jgi:hypothetical protein
MDSITKALFSGLILRTFIIMDRTTAEIIFLVMCVVIGLLGVIVDRVTTTRRKGGDDDNQG